MLISWLFVPHPFIHSFWILTSTISKIIRGFIKSISWPLIAFWSMTQLWNECDFAYFLCSNVHVVSLYTCLWIRLSVEMMKMTLFDVLMALFLKWMKSLFQENLTSVASVNDLFCRKCMTLTCPMLNGLRGYQNRWLLIKDEWLPLFKCKWSRGYWNNDLFCQEWMSSACPRVNDLRGYWNKWLLVQHECLPLVKE